MGAQRAFRRNVRRERWREVIRRKLSSYTARFVNMKVMVASLQFEPKYGANIANVATNRLRMKQFAKGTEEEDRRIGWLREIEDQGRGLSLKVRHFIGT